MQQVTTDLSAYDIYRVFEKTDHIFLDSSKVDLKLGRYSVIGINPFSKLVYNDGILTLNGSVIENELFAVLNRIIEENRIENIANLPYCCGGLGYLTYDLGMEMAGIAHDISKKDNTNITIPEAYFVFYDNMIIYDHCHSCVTITGLGKLDDPLTSIGEIIAAISGAKRQAIFSRERREIHLASPFTRDGYMTAIGKMRNHIRKGDIYIANMTHTFAGKMSREPSQVYKCLREINPAPFSAYLPLEGFYILSSSPERFLKIAGRHVSTRPIKGTRPRGSDLQSDLTNRQELLASEKDRSELLMIVDLERNDLSKVCEPFSVKVNQLFEIEAYATVFHLISDIEGKLKDGVTAIECIRNCFPGGSITGAPKRRAMEIIDDLEIGRRGIYTGSIAYLGFDGKADLSIVIRTMVIKDGNVEIGVGGGITWESECDFEYEETLAKAQALFMALETLEINELNP